MTLSIKDYLGNKKFYKKALLIALPVMGQQLVTNLVNLIDNFMVSGLGDVKMSGVNVSGQIIFVFNVLIAAICTSGGIFLTQYFGAKSKKGMRQALSFKIWLGLGLLILFSLVCFVFNSQVISLMLTTNTQAIDIIEEGKVYMSLMGFTGIFFITSNIIGTSLREIGNVKTPLIISIIAAIVNSFFNWVLIYGNLGAPRLEIKGAAYATILARFVECCLFIAYVSFKKQPFAIKFKDVFNIDKDLLKDMLKKTGMIMFSELIWVISETVTSAIYNGRGGADVVSGMSASFSIANLFFISFNGITAATSVIIGKTLGEGKLEEARKQNRYLFSGSIIFGFMAMLVAFVDVLLIPLLYGSLSISAQNICKDMIMYLAFFMPLWVLQNYQFAVSRAGGDTKLGFLVDGIFTVGVYFPLLFILALKTNIGPAVLYLICKLVDIPKVIFAQWWLKKELWLKNLTSDSAL